VTFLLYRFPFSFGVLDTGRFLNGVLTALLLVCTRGLVARARPVGHRASQGAVAPELIHLWNPDNIVEFVPLHDSLSTGHVRAILLGRLGHEHGVSQTGSRFRGNRENQNKSPPKAFNNKSVFCLFQLLMVIRITE
jgi:hypothetical protein